MGAGVGVGGAECRNELSSVSVGVGGAECHNELSSVSVGVSGAECRNELSSVSVGVGGAEEQPAAAIPSRRTPNTSSPLARAANLCYLPMAWAASGSVSTIANSSPDSDRIRLPSSTLVPSIRTTSGGRRPALP